MTKIRGAKTLAQKSLRWPVAALEIVGQVERRGALVMVAQTLRFDGELHG